MMPLRLRSARHHAAISVFPCSTYKAKMPPRFLNAVAYGMRSVSLRTSRIPPRCFGSALTQALPCNPCPLPPHPPALPIHFFSKFSSPCGSIRSLKSAFFIGGLSILGEQVSPEHLQTHIRGFGDAPAYLMGLPRPIPSVGTFLRMCSLAPVKQSQRNEARWQGHPASFRERIWYGKTEKRKGTET